MKRNMSNLDRISRMVLAVIFGTLYFAKIVTGVGGTVLLVLGIILLLTGVIGMCPIYSIFRLSTHKDKEHKTA